MLQPETSCLLLAKLLHMLSVVAGGAELHRENIPEIVEWTLLQCLRWKSPEAKAMSGGTEVKSQIFNQGRVYDKDHESHALKGIEQSW